MAEAGVKASVRNGAWSPWRRVGLLGLCAWALQGCAHSGAETPQATTQAQSQAQSQRETTMTKRVSGPFDVKLTPMAPDANAGEAVLGRMTLDKQFHGDLAATSKGQMLAAGTAVEGSAGYVALERVSGRLAGREGTFMLQHSGTMARGKPSLSVTVIPDSGTGQLTGLTGSMQIDIDAQGKHTYTFDYTLPE